MSTLQTSNGVYFTVLPPRPVELLGWEVRIYDIDNPNTLLGYVVHWKNLQFTEELNGVGNGSVQIRLDDPAVTEPLPLGVFSAGVLEEGNIFRIFWNGVQRGAFVHDQDREPEITMDEDGGVWIEIAGDGIGSLLNRPAVFPKNWAGYPAAYDPANKNHVWTAKSYGAMWLDLFGFAANRGSVNDMATSFTATKDSHELAWVFTSDVDLQPGGNLLGLLERWGEIAFDWYVDHDLTVHAWQEYGQHLEESVRFWAGGDIRTTEKNSDRREIKNVVVVEASDGSTASAVDTASIGRWLRREVYLTAGEAQDVTTAQQYADAALRAAKDESVERTLTVVADAPDRTVFVDYGIGDWISLVAGTEAAPDSWSEPEAVRVLAITVAIDDDTADAQVELTIQSKLQAAMVKVWRKLQQLAIQREGTAGNVSTPVESGSKAELGAQQGEIDALQSQVNSLELDDLLDVDAVTNRDNGDQLTWDAAQGLWVPASPGGLSVREIKDKAWVRGSAAHALDDEFDNAALAGAWTRVDRSGNSAPVVWTEAGDVVSMRHDGADNDSEFHGLVKSLGGATFPLTFETAFRTVGPYAANYNMNGLVLADGTTYGAGKQIMVMPFIYSGIAGYQWSWRTFQNWSSGISSYGEYGLGVYNGPLYVRITWSAANTFSAGWSPDGVSWMMDAAQTYAFTPTYAGLTHSHWANNRRTISSFEYFRVF